MSARIAPAKPPFSEDIQAAFDRIMPPGVPPLALFTTLARDARLFARLRGGALLDKGHLTLRQREVVISRVTARSGSEYEWGVHVAFFAKTAGLDAAMLELARERRRRRFVLVVRRPTPHSRLRSAPRDVGHRRRAVVGDGGAVQRHGADRDSHAGGLLSRRELPHQRAAPAARNPTPRASLAVARAMRPPRGPSSPTSSARARAIPRPSFL